MPRAYKQLGKVADGRIRKNWPAAPPFGPTKKSKSMPKGFVNHLEPKAVEDGEEEDEEEDEIDLEWLKLLTEDELFENDVRKGDDGNFYNLKGDPLLFEVSKEKMVAVSCYKLAMLQCLMHVPEFVHYLSRSERCGNWRCYTEPINESLAYRCVFCALRDLALHYWTSTNAKSRQRKVMAVHKAMELHAVRNPGDRNNGVYQQLTPGRQHDSHEYFMAMVQMLHKLNEPHMIDEIVENSPIVNVAVDRLFETKLKRQWTCTDCHAINSRRKADFGLHVQMPRSRKYNRPPWLLSDCVRSCSRPERVRRLCNSATCGGKKDKDRVEETIITHGPEILVIQIIRMTYNRVTGRTNKIMDWVHMNKLLDLSQHTTLRIGAPTPVAGDEFNTNKPLRYQLHGVVSHSGSILAGGHYVATVRCRNGVDFVRVNDRVVTDFATDKEENLLEVDDGEFQSYIAVYQKVGGKMANCI